MNFRCISILLVLSIALSIASNVQAGLLLGGIGRKDVSDNPESVFNEDWNSGIKIRGVDSIKLPAGKLDYPRVPASVILAENSTGMSRSPGTRRRMLVSILLSAVLPGMGEAYLYLDGGELSTIARVPVFLAAEVYFWHGYFHNHKKGKDYKQYYMDYADEHWDLNRFLIQHPCCSALDTCPDYNYYNEHCEGEFNYFLYTPKGIDEEEYYENIGKYDAFVYGWDDWNGQPDYWTPHRRYYWEMRKHSDYYLTKGDNFLMWLLVNRVVSMVDAGWLAYRMSRGHDLDSGWSINFKSIRYAPSIEVVYRF